MGLHRPVHRHRDPDDRGRHRGDLRAAAQLLLGRVLHRLLACPRRPRAGHARGHRRDGLAPLAATATTRLHARRHRAGHDQPKRVPNRRLDLPRLALDPGGHRVRARGSPDPRPRFPVVRGLLAGRVGRRQHLRRDRRKCRRRRIDPLRDVVGPRPHRACVRRLLPVLEGHPCAGRPGQPGAPLTAGRPPSAGPRGDGRRSGRRSSRPP